uniref:Peptidase C14 caspase domain-containing protein n=1 Tax=Magnetococcus massalia (strain MO-1) TaxID=451514 RepID=A0A1S7LHI4_MAGMO|nr:Protein of unknown function. Containing eptidase C14, caspase catalytic subunit p20 domain [Candidatus Magnetococcus massalia]
MRFFSALLIIVAMLLVQDAEARRGFARAAGVQSINRAITSQVRQIFKPTFRIKSRYAAPMTALDMDKSGKWLASGNEKGELQLWRMKSGQRALNLPAQSGAAVQQVLFVPSRVAISETTGRVRTRSATRRPEYLLAGYRDGTATLWNLRTEMAVRQFGPLQGELVGMGVHIRGRLFMASNTGETALFNIQTGAKESGVKHALGPLSAAAISHNGRRLALASKQGGLELWRIDISRRILQLPGRGTEITALAWNENDDLVVGRSDGSLSKVEEGDDKYSKTWQGHDNAIRVLRFSSSGEMLASGSADHAVRVWDKGALSGGSGATTRGIGGGGFGGFGGDEEDEDSFGGGFGSGSSSSSEKSVLKGHKKPINDLLFMPGKKGLLFSAGEDRMVRLWQTAKQKEQLRLVSMREGWAAVTPEGFFDGTLDGNNEERLDAIHWSGDKDSYAIDGFMERYYTPALMGRVVAGKKLPKLDETSRPDVEKGIGYPPAVTWLSPNAESAVPGESEVSFKVTNRGGGIGEVRLYHNGRIVNPEKGQVEKQEGKNEVHTYRFTIPWLAGKNTLRAVALSDQRIEGSPQELSVNHAGGLRKSGNIHIFVVGINEYYLKELTLNFGVPDARGVLTFFQDNRLDLFKGKAFYQLYDAAATRESIFDVLAQRLESIPVEDTVVLYLAGHGEIVDDVWYFLPHELDDTTDGRISGQGLSSRNIGQKLAKIPARNLLMVVDACKSGSLADSLTRFEERRPMAMLSRSTGVHIATSTTSEQLANELGTLGHGVFTYTLLKGLEGEADRFPKDGKLNVMELLKHVRERVPELSEELELDEQNPTMYMRGADFPLIHLQ